ncbi:MAG: ComF family protein [Paludibacteraceae bacterium]|nr:ComF family protein [Paludibacteraceae bacterium]
MIRLGSALNGFVELFYPRLCVGCGRKLFQDEHFLCVECLSSLPLAQVHESEDNFVEQHLYGRPYIESATTLMVYGKETVPQKIIHEIKYHGAKELAQSMGRMLGRQMKGGRFSSVDMIVPVPLHPKRLKWRGYNQSEWIAKGLSEELGVPVRTDLVERVVETSTQTNKNAEERWSNVKGIFALRQEVSTEGLKDHHLLIVDDVITTGSTLMACAAAFSHVDNVKISAASLAAVN